MGCMAPLPAGYQLKIAHFLTGQLAQRASDAGEARKHVQRAINALVGPNGVGFREEPDVKNPVHGLGDGTVPYGAIPYLEVMVGQKQVENAKEAHTIAEVARKVALLCREKHDLRDVQRLSKAVSLLLEAALEVIRF